MKIFKRIIVLIVALCAISAFAMDSTDSYTRVLNLNWGIELPETGAKEIFTFSEPDFHGDGIRYHVIDYPAGKETKEARNTVFQLEKIFLQSSQPTETQIKNVRQLLEQVDIKDDVIPEWETCRLLYRRQEDSSELFLFYRSETGTVYIVESFF